MHLLRGHVVVVEPAQDGTWAGFILDLPVFAWGKGSVEEVLASLEEGLRLYEEALREGEEE